MEERSGKSKKVTIIVVAAVLILMAVGTVMWVRNQNEFPKDINGDGYLQDYGVEAEECKELMENHKEAFDCIVETVKKQPKELFFKIGFDNKGKFYVKGEMEYDENFIEAMNDIYTDEIFRRNPNCYMGISWIEEYGWYIDFRLFLTTGSHGGMMYREKPREYKDPDTQVDLDENWYWYWYGNY